MIVKSKELFTKVLEQLSLADKAEARAIVEYLFQAKFGLTRTDIMSNRILNVVDIDFSKIINRINRHEPIQYITETAWFASRQFFVTPSVLIPRPETEIIVNYVATVCNSAASVLDVGTGSGCIAISLKLNNPNLRVSAIDISADALAIARKNATLLNADVTFLAHDFLQSDTQSMGNFDFLVSNPPYVLDQEKSTMDETVLAFEPHLALFVPNHDPLLFYKALAEKGKKLLNPNGMVVAEINPKYALPTANLFSRAGFSVETIKDMEGKNRTIAARLMN
jgi:release factor glutamine methyltransferase